MGPWLQANQEESKIRFLWIKTRKTKNKTRSLDDVFDFKA